MDWDATLSPDVLRLFVLEANSLSTPGLLRLIAYMVDNGLDASEYRLTLWRKLVAPITVMAMMLFAVPFCLGSQRGGGAGQRLLIGDGLWNTMKAKGDYRLFVTDVPAGQVESSSHKGVFGRLRELLANRTDIEVVGNLGFQYFLQNKFSQASSYTQKALALGDQEPSLLRTTKRKSSPSV